MEQILFSSALDMPTTPLKILFSNRYMYSTRNNPTPWEWYTRQSHSRVTTHGNNTPWNPSLITATCTRQETTLYRENGALGKTKSQVGCEVHVSDTNTTCHLQINRSHYYKTFHKSFAYIKYSLLTISIESTQDFNRLSRLIHTSTQSSLSFM